MILLALMCSCKLVLLILYKKKGRVACKEAHETSTLCLLHFFSAFKKMLFIVFKIMFDDLITIDSLFIVSQFS